ncbi:hypothetical protein C922_05755 [Plasmodium inui San Antonio 1]|uniref:Uncharacterized protein n=1 Tax=Plasmodium inui San Antonio 1 TaxID=1237626 RepID=W7A446_9APIC|nr:hypothetical protein C922_05755 [Plasmodium inui San Antonio 1]EUD63864.1 hypothetical protein C922_05755 [Plasmodium inui San Antonio 1]
MDMNDMVRTVIAIFLKGLTPFTYSTHKYVILDRKIKTPQGTSYTKSAERISEWSPDKHLGKLVDAVSAKNPFNSYIISRRNQWKGANCSFHGLWNYRNSESNVDSDRNHYEESTDT